MNDLLTINNLVKDYGRIRAVNGLSLHVDQGCVFGLLGPNGSGKTTTLGIILDVIKKTSGSYTWFGKPSNARSRQQIGAILEVPAFYPYLSARRNLSVIAQIKGRGAENIEKIVETVGLKERIDDPFRTYSLGMKQRLAIGAALLSDPPVLILDEPTNGLDPQGIAEIRNVELGHDVLSPPAHKAFSDPIGLLKFLRRLRELSGGKPVGFKLCVGDPTEFLAICKA